MSELLNFFVNNLLLAALLYIFTPYISGTGKATGFQEQASVVVETVTKTSVMSKFASLPPFVSDASKVTCEGNGLKKGYRNKQCTFNVDTSQAGKHSGILI